MEQLKNVLVLYVGGTIGMQRNDKGIFIPATNAFLEQIKYHSELHDPLKAEKLGRILKDNELVLPLVKRNTTVLYEIVEYDPLLDSSNMSYKDWINIAKDVGRNYSMYDGFVILHGTDTIAYTASALSFMLVGLKKPVILTGSQIPIFETRNDAKDNFLSSLIIAGCYDVPEVCVFFANKLLRGNRTVKISPDDLDAFDSPKYRTLADVGIEVKVNSHYLRRPDNVPFTVRSNLNPNVAILYFCPTTTGQMMEDILKPPIEGLVLQSYGAGNIPSHRDDILAVLKAAVEREILIINITQCARGHVSIYYETGQVLDEIGIVSGTDMTTEAALTKLMYILGLPNQTYEQRVKLMKTDLRGELSVDI